MQQNTAITEHLLSITSKFSDKSPALSVLTIQVKRIDADISDVMVIVKYLLNAIKSQLGSYPICARELLHDLKDRSTIIGSKVTLDLRCSSTPLRFDDVILANIVTASRDSAISWAAFAQCMTIFLLLEVE